MIFFSNRRAYNGRLTIGRSKEGLPLVGFKYQRGYDWLDLNSKQEGVRLVGFKYQRGYDWLDLNSKQEGVRLVRFKYQKGYDWLNSQFHCPYLDSRGVPGKTRLKQTAGNYHPFISGSRLPVTSFSVMQLPVAHAHPITSGTTSNAV